MAKQETSSNYFIGRDQEIQQLRDHFDWVQTNEKPRVIFVSGEPGVGKTTFIKQFLYLIKANKKQRFIHSVGSCSLEKGIMA